MGWEFNEHQVRPNVHYWSPKAHKERNEVKTRREQAQKAYDEAKRATASGHHADAEQRLLLAVTAWPDNPRYSLALANCIFLDRGRPHDAMTWYDETVRLRDCPAHRAARSRALSAVGRLDAALEDMDVAAEGEPEHPDYRVGRAMLLERLGRFSEAAQEYGEALPLLRAAGRPVFECLFNRGYCYKLLGQSEEAIAELEAAMLQSTTSMTVRTVLGVLYLSKRRYAKALDVFSVVAQQQPASASAPNNAALAAYLAATADYDDSSAATRAASLMAQRQRAAAAAAASARAGLRAGAGAGDDGADAGGSLSRSLAHSVTLARGQATGQVADGAAAAGGSGTAAAAGAVAALAPGGARTLAGGGSTGRGTASSSVAALLDSRVARDEGPLAVPAPRDARPGVAAAGRGAGGPDVDDDTDSGDEGGGGQGGVAGGGREPPPIVYLPADPRQWAADVVRDNESLAVADNDKRILLEQALQRFDVALANQRRLEAERRVAEAERRRREEQREAIASGRVAATAAALAAAAAAGGGDGGRESERPGRNELDADTTAVVVGEGGDIPGGLLLVVRKDNRTPGTAVVHDREIEDGEVQYNRGLVLLSLGRLAEAEADLDAALAANPHHAHYPYYQAVVCARRGQDDKAIQWDNLALQRNPRYFHALYHLGLVLALRGEAREAIARLDAAAALRPRDWRIMEARARVLQDLDRHSEALPALQAALAAVRADGDQPPAVAARLHFAMAQSAVAAHQPHLLRESLRQARLHGQDPASVYNLRGCLARKERQFHDALRYLSRAVRRAPQGGDARFLYDRAQCYADMGQWPEAIDDLTAALELMPSAPLLYFSRGAAHLQYDSGDTAAAAEDLARAAELCGGVLRGEGPLWESRKFMSSGAGSPDLSPSLWYQLGCAQARCGRAPAAVASFRRACSTMPGHPVFLHELAKACQAAGDYAEALDSFNKVIALQPRNARAYLRRGLVLKCLKRYDDAAGDFMTARRLEPSNPTMQLDPRMIGEVQALELCAPGAEDEAFLLTRF